MNSAVAERMDDGGFLYEACGVKEIFDELVDEFGDSSYGKEKYSENELYWIGYIYRYWSYTCGMSSKQLYNIIKPKELRTLYYPYHSLDPSQAIERILESKGLLEEDLTQKGVRLLRELMKKEKNFL